jgi:hypothetical protein
MKTYKRQLNNNFFKLILILRKIITKSEVDKFLIFYKKNLALQKTKKLIMMKIIEIENLYRGFNSLLSEKKVLMLWLIRDTQETEIPPLENNLTKLYKKGKEKRNKKNLNKKRK